MRPAVLPEFRPTLADLLRPRIGTLGVRVLAVVAAVVAVAFLGWLIRPADDGIDVVHRDGPVTFNLRHVAALGSLPPRGDELLRLEGRRGQLFLQSFVVSPLSVPAFEGDITGALPVLAAREIEALRRRYAEFELVEDGKARVNEVVAYTILFRARQGKRRLYGRVVLLPEPVAKPTRGVVLALLATPAAGVSNATEVGSRGTTKLPYRTFRFGTEKP